jgi:hypothetical protein
MRVRHFRLVLSALAGALAILLGVEWLLPGNGAPPPPVAIIPAGAPDAGGGGAVDQWANTILARPIFNQNRRPEAVASGTSDAPPPRLSAIIIVGGSRRAIFSAAGAKPAVVGEGGEVGAYQVKAIGAGSVALLGPDGGISTLRLQYLSAAAVDVANSGQ